MKPTNETIRVTIDLALIETPAGVWATTCSRLKYDDILKRCGGNHRETRQYIQEMWEYEFIRIEGGTTERTMKDRFSPYANVEVIRKA